MFAKYYRWPSIASFVVFLAGLVMGWFTGHTVSSVIDGGLSVLLLIAIEISMSGDNAVMNATILKNLSESARAWFLRWGILVAVVGMRFAFPITIVSVFGHIGLYDALQLGIMHPDQYSAILESSSQYIAAFGGSFLLLTAFSFFLDSEKDSHWVPGIERFFTKLGGTPTGYLITVLNILIGAIVMTDDKIRGTYIASGFAGILTFAIVGKIKDYLESHNPIGSDGERTDESSSGNRFGWLAKTAFGSLLYLEIMDASMSFDGVIGALAITKNIFMIMASLGAGAWFVRAMTKHLVDADVMGSYEYLEHGAQWAILTLAVCMFINVFTHVPDLVTGLVGVFMLGTAILTSKKEKAE